MNWLDYFTEGNNYCAMGMSNNFYPEISFSNNCIGIHDDRDCDDVKVTWSRGENSLSQTVTDRCASTCYCASRDSMMTSCRSTSGSTTRLRFSIDEILRTDFGPQRDDVSVTSSERRDHVTVADVNERLGISVFRSILKI